MCVCLQNVSVCVCECGREGTCARAYMCLYTCVRGAFVIFVHFDVFGIHADAFVCFLLRELNLAPKNILNPCYRSNSSFLEDLGHN